MTSSCVVTSTLLFVASLPVSIVLYFLLSGTLRMIAVTPLFEKKNITKNVQLFLKHFVNCVTCLRACSVLLIAIQFSNLGAFCTCDECVNKYVALTSIPLFPSGDSRVNENVALTSMHTIWTREHNRIEEQLHLINPHWDGERLFQETRRIVIALFQHVISNEFLPTVLGPDVMRRFRLGTVKNGYYTGQYDHCCLCAKNR